MGKSIHTVLGEIDPSELGFTQCHEHLMIRKGKSYEVNPAICIDDPQKSLAEVEAFRKAGGGSVVDAQPGGCCRDPEALIWISEKSGVPVIASTGFHKMIYYPEGHWIFSLNEKDLTEYYIRELTKGMYTDGDTGIPQKRCGAKAGILKTALDVQNLTGRYGELHRAAITAELETGAPLMVHIEPGSSPEALVEELKKRGVDLTRVYFCHMDRACPDFETFLHVLDAGVSLEFDTIGRFNCHSDEEEVSLILRILSEGYEDQLLFSLDTTRARMKSYEPDGVGLTYILRTFLPMLREAGVTEKQIEKISVSNPARILSW